MTIHNHHKKTRKELKENKKIEEKASTLKLKKMYNRRYRHKWTNPKPNNCLKCGELEHWAQE